MAGALLQHEVSRTSDSFGARLRRERERRQISIESIADSTKILGALLDRLEHDDVSRWPTGFYRRAFIRAYACAIGLDPEPVVREFIARFPEPDDVGFAPAATTPSKAAPALTIVAPVPSSRASAPLMASAVPWRERFSAIAFDAFVLLVIAVSFYLAFGAFWAPFGLGAVAYYFGSVLALGTTLGIHLFPTQLSRHV
ncbi:MAG TPA: helix-turn-helix transcriptional regulator [Vicinamibacterales bacterium]|nr:helix-turn-helix transcriptional regulator [Vicinamibacterales bacterium]